MLLEIAEIEIGDRARTEFGDLNELALSINTYGLIQPIVVVPHPEPGKFKFLLVAGERRVRAHQMLNKTEIDSVLREELTDQERLEIELEENLRRQAFTWQEEVALKAKIDGLKRSSNQKNPVTGVGGWTLQDTANLLGVSKSGVGIDIDLAKGIEVYPELKQEKNKSSALKKLKRLEEERLRKMLAERMRERQAAGGATVDVEKVMHGDCLVMLDKVKPSSVHLVIVDPPYGIDFTDQIDDNNSAGYTHFADDKAGTIDMIDMMLTKLAQVMTANSSIYMFFSITHYDVIFKLMSRYFDVDPMPLVWFKQNLGGGRVTIPEIYQCRSYEVMFYGRKGKRELIKQGQPNVLSFDVVPPRQKIHPTEKPAGLLRELIDRSSVQSETVLDCCAGSGSTLIAAKQMDRDFIGIEQNEHYYNAIIQRLAFKSEPLVAEIEETLDEAKGVTDAEAKLLAQLDNLLAE